MSVHILPSCTISSSSLLLLLLARTWDSSPISMWSGTCQKKTDGHPPPLHISADAHKVRKRQRERESAHKELRISMFWNQMSCRALAIYWHMTNGFFGACARCWCMNARAMKTLKWWHLVMNCSNVLCWCLGTTLPLRMLL